MTDTKTPSFPTNQEIADFFGVDGLSYEFVEAMPIDFDFSEGYDYDQDGTGTWFITSHPSVADQLDALDVLEVDEYQGEPMLVIDPPTDDGEITVSFDHGVDGMGDHERLVFREALNKALARLGIEAVDDDDLDSQELEIEVDDAGWAQLLALWNLSKEVFDEDNPDSHSDQWDPVMNYAYPIGNVPEDWHRAMRCCTVVDIGGGKYLALTGGGMDFSWEICETYIRCGYLPPRRFARLPGMAGRGTHPTDRMIMAACRLSVMAVRDRAADALADLEARIPAALDETQLARVCVD